MTKNENTPTAALKMAAAGWAAGLCLISLFVFGLNDPDPQWGSYWRIRPLLLTPLIAGTGAFLAYRIFSMGAGSPLRKVIFAVLAVCVFLVCLWIGTILGLSGTLWN